MTRRLEDRVAIVTGASSGLGRAIALQLAEEGARIVCADLDREPKPGGFETEASAPTDIAIAEKGGAAVFVKCDVGDVGNVTALIEATVGAFGRVDIMVNNAGVFTRLAKIHECTEEEYDFTMRVNAKGVYNGCQQAIIQFLKQGDGGKIVNVASGGGLVGLAQEPPYCASKGAVVNLTRQLAGDYGADGINVNAVCPGGMFTSMTRQASEDPGFSAMMEATTPLRRWARVEEVAKLVVFLASDEAAYITGAVVPIDGGYTAM